MTGYRVDSLFQTIKSLNQNSIIYKPSDVTDSNQYQLQKCFHGEVRGVVLVHAIS